MSTDENTEPSVGNKHLTDDQCPSETNSETDVPQMTNHDIPKRVGEPHQKGEDAEEGESVYVVKWEHTNEEPVQKVIETWEDGINCAKMMMQPKIEGKGMEEDEESYENEADINWHP